MPLPHGPADTAMALAAIQLADGKVPDEILLMPAGRVQPRPHDGREAWINDRPEAVIAATRELASDLVVDYEHQTDLAGKNGQPAPAAGWIKEVFLRDGAIWGRVEWTERARAHIAAGEYRFISPSFFHDRQSRRVNRIVGAGLTNNPALFMRAIATAETIEESETMNLKALAAAHGLPEDATEEQILAAAKAAREALANTAKAAGLDDKADAKAVVDKVGELSVAAARTATVDPAKYVPVDQHQALAARLDKVETAAVEEKATAAVEAATKAGKLTPSARDWALGYAKADPDGFAAWEKTAPVILKDGRAAPPTDPSGSGGLTPDQKAVARAMGLTEDEYKKAGTAEGEAA